jgi:glycosyltransferase involved in cell wall biosynthesis
MKILHVNAHEIDGGAARAALRLDLGMMEVGIDARLLVRSKATDRHFVIGPDSYFDKARSLIHPVLTELRVSLCSKRKGGMFSPAFLPDLLAEKIAAFDPDIVHLHWVVGGFLRIETLKKLGKPLVWTLHDSWPFTGGCHLPGSCLRYREKCGLCPVLGARRENDLSRRVWQRKFRSWRDLRIEVVCPSHWLAQCARSSSLFADRNVTVIPNGIDTSLFKPLDKAFSRDAMGLPEGKKLILCGANHFLVDRNKGYNLLASAVKAMPQELAERSCLLVFGSAEPEDLPDLGLEVRFLGHLGDKYSMVLAYSAADVFVTASRQENLPYTIMEAMACGTPAVGFAVGGIPELIEHGCNGYLAEPFAIEDLSRGITWVLEDSTRHGELSAGARRAVLDKFALEKVVRQYTDLYRQILSSSGEAEY